MFHEEGNRSNSFVRPEQYTQCVFAAFQHTGLLFLMVSTLLITGRFLNLECKCSDLKIEFYYTGVTITLLFHLVPKYLG